MPARTKRIFHDANTRAKIQASQIINRLTKHILADAGDEIMSSSQVSAALGLLRKTLPDLQAVELSNDPDAPLTIQIVRHGDNSSAS